MQTIHGSNSYIFDTAEISLAITRQGGHMAPVRFHLPDGDASPYALAPWLPDECDATLPKLLTELRGDFFCLPFGGQNDGPPHGETANGIWELLEQTDTNLTLICHDPLHQATVKKSISTKPGHHAIYVSHEISGLSGHFNYGNHPILDFSSLPQGAGRVSVSPFRWASVYHGHFANPETGETGILKSAATFTSLDEVPLTGGGNIDLTKYPSPSGHEDLVMMVNEPSTPTQPFAWSAVNFGSYIWFSLKLPEDFPATLFWISNGGRPAHPWNSRHTARLGIEEVCSYFCDSIDQSRLDLLAHLNVPTTRLFTKDQPTTLRIIQGVATCPAAFGKVLHITPTSEGILIHGENNQSVSVPLDTNFLAEKTTNQK